MASIFLCYRRTDGPQACRVYDWLCNRFGADAVFMDVSAIPFAVSFSEFIRAAIANSKILIALIGADWHARIEQPDDTVRMEIETALSNGVPVLPVLIGDTPMPGKDALPDSISQIAAQNAVTVGVLHSFHTHMQGLLPKIESILGAMARQSKVTADARIVQIACDGIIRYLHDRFLRSDYDPDLRVEWRSIGTADFGRTQGNLASLFLHRITRLAESMELHFILSFWGHASNVEYLLAGWVVSELERTPIIPESYFDSAIEEAVLELRIRRSDEDARQVWKMVTNEPLRLSLSYVATISPRSAAPESAPESTRRRA